MTETPEIDNLELGSVRFEELLDGPVRIYNDTNPLEVAEWKSIIGILNDSKIFETKESSVNFIENVPPLLIWEDKIREKLEMGIPSKRIDALAGFLAEGELADVESIRSGKEQGAKPTIDERYANKNPLLILLSEVVKNRPDRIDKEDVQTVVEGIRRLSDERASVNS